MENTTLFDDYNDCLIMFYKICSPICLIFNLLAVYLIVFKSSNEMKTYRWHLLNYQIWASSIDILLNVFFQPIMFYPVMAITGNGIPITDFGVSSFACLCAFGNLLCFLTVSIVELFLYRHQCIVRSKLSKKKFYLCILLQFSIQCFFTNIFFKLSNVDSSQWSEMLEEWNPKAIEVLKFPYVYCFPYSPILGIILLILMISYAFSGSFSSSLIFHILYILRKQSQHLSTRTKKMQKKFLISLILQTTTPFVFIIIPLIFFCARILDGRLGLQILNNLAMVMISSYGILATLFLIYFNDPYREFIARRFQARSEYMWLSEEWFQ